MYKICVPKKVISLIIIYAIVFIIPESEKIFAQKLNFSNRKSSLNSPYFDNEWKFTKGDVTNAQIPGYDDHLWRTVDLPHDWSIEDLPNQSDSVKGPFSKNSIGGTATGYAAGGTGWYRKSFALKPADTHKIVSISFDGVYMISDVWINGHYLGNHPNGYTPFYYELSKYLDFTGKPNVVAVRVKNEGKNSRWYSGSGIYRHVWLNIAEPIHTGQAGIYVSTSDVSEKSALVNVITAIENELLASKTITLRTTILDAQKNVVKTIEKTFGIAAHSKVNVPQSISLSNLKLWSPETPVLYSVQTELTVDKKVIEQKLTYFGIRSIKFDAAEGFRLNGKRVLLKGGCLHHDNGPLGAAAIDRAEERKVELLKSNGFNSVRTSHNPPSKQFLDACDRLGLLVIDESFDMWERPKNANDYHLYFDSCWKKDIQSFVLRDRNHPSVIMWSVGNEIPERADSAGLVLTKALRSEVRLLDSTRPITEAICDFWETPGTPWDKSAPAYALLDVGGYNYMWKQYIPDHQKFPKRVMAGTESFPMEAFENWRAVKKYPWVIGDFVWTAMDYMGETAIGHTVLDNEEDGPALKWPWFNAWCGDIDLIGGKKPQSYYRDVVWGRSKIAMAIHTPIPEGRTEKISRWGWPNELQSWTWKGQEGKLMKVSVYSGGSLVRLQLNGRVVGEQAVSEKTKLTATFEVPYAAGTLKAFNIKNGKAADSVIFNTAGIAGKINLTPDRANITSNRNDLAYISVDLTDIKGNVVQDDDIVVKFSVKGPAEIAGVGNANPKDMRSFQKPECRLFRGKGLIILRPTGKKGKIELRASAASINSLVSITVL
jgi:beta-galactosidase